jgi:hypothetical protein
MALQVIDDSSGVHELIYNEEFVGHLEADGHRWRMYDARAMVFNRSEPRPMGEGVGGGQSPSFENIYSIHCIRFDSIHFISLSHPVSA